MLNLFQLYDVPQFIQLTDNSDNVRLLVTFGNTEISRGNWFFTLELTPYHVNTQRVDSTAVALTLTQHLNSRFLICLLNSSEDTGFTLIEICNTQLTFFQLLQCDRVEKHLSRLCSMVYNKIKTVYRSGAKRYQYDKKTFSISIFKDELVNVAALNCKILEFDHEKVLLEKKM